MACVIQCAWRKHLAVCELMALKEKRREEEEAENSAMAEQDEMMIIKRLNAAARKIQTLHKLFAAKRERKIREALRDRHAELLSNFSMHRAAMGRAHVLRSWRFYVQIQKTERENAAVTLQRCIRASFSRKLYKRLLQKKHNQDRIIEICLGKKSASVKKLILEEWKRFLSIARHTKVRAATAIQCFFRSCSARRRYRVALRRHKITIELMNRILFDRNHRIMLKSWSALSSNAVWHRMRKRSSATLIQKRVRGMRGRRIAKNVRSRKRRVELTIKAMQKKSAKQMAKLVFLSLQRNVDVNCEERDSCSTSIQRVFRGFRARKRVRVVRECEKMLGSPGLTLKAQSRDFVLRLCFLILARFPEQEATTRLRSASRIQKWWRACCKRRKLRVASEKLAKRKAILMRLEANFKLFAKVFLNELKKAIHARKWRQNRSARKIQHALRAWITRRRYVRVLEKKADAVARANELERQKRDSWLLRVLNAWRNALIDDKQQTNRAATRIQRMYRARIAKKKASKVVAKKAAQARLLGSVHMKPLERCFRKWESLLIEKCTLSVRSALKTPMFNEEKRKLLASKGDSRLAPHSREPLSLEQVSTSVMHSIIVYGF